MLQAALDALSAHVAVLDTKGIVVAVNRAWRRFGSANGLQLPNFGIGTNYLSVMPSADSGASSLISRLRRVLQGRSAGFSHEYACGQRRFLMQVRGLGRLMERRVFVAHEDITDLKAAEHAVSELRNQLASSRESERSQLARELHDTTGQELLVVSLNLMHLEKLIGESNQEGRQLLDEMRLALERAQRDLRTMSYLIHPISRSGTGLEGTLRAFVRGFSRRTGIKTSFAANYRGDRASEHIERAILSVAQEALINVYRHSGSKTAQVRLRVVNDHIELHIADQGEWSAGDEGVGFLSMRERIRHIGGSLSIRPHSGGTEVRAVIPHGEH
jgi:signal transduction histidine kinase